jgi:DNA-binding transcriptional LysR family regulator
VAEELHFGRAAEKLSISQPPLSQQIQSLEKELGAKLFHRTSRSVELTGAGKVFLIDAKRIIGDTEQAVVDARRASRGELGRIGIGFVASATYEALPDILSRFRLDYPDVALDLYEMNAARQAPSLRDNKIDVAFARPEVTGDDLATETILTENLLAAVPESFRVKEDAIRLTELADEPFILYPRDPKPSYADYIIGICENAGFSPRISQETQQMQTALSLVSAGLGVTLVPASLLNMRRRGVIYLPFTVPAPVTRLSVVHRLGDKSPILKNFLETARAGYKRICDIK